MDPYQDKDLRRGGSPPPDPDGTPEVLDIFRHAWPVIWERPVAAVGFVAALALAETVADGVCDRLLAPFTPALAEFLAKGPGDQAAAAQVTRAVEASGGWRLALGCLIPFLMMPFVSFAVCRAALSLWDGYSPRAGDLAFALASYARAFTVFLFLSVYGAALGCLTALMALPLWALVKASGGGPGYLFGAVAAVAGALLWAHLVWPLARRYLFLQFFVYFRMSDHPGLGGLLREAVRLNRALVAWPTHLNVLCALTAAVVIGTLVAVGTALAVIPSLEPREPVMFLANGVYLLAFLWPAVTAAGFYRLCLRPAEDVYLPGTGPDGRDPGTGGEGYGPGPGADGGEGYGPDPDADGGEDAENGARHPEDGSQRDPGSGGREDGGDGSEKGGRP
ncbi:MAG: hypothetical protein LBQ79_10300 [Deltaproteobacteria bacterium]|jgi:hypothetical protein|nr:hypothetical protein [Deltaproteobacteria bacterium]